MSELEELLKTLPDGIFITADYKIYKVSAGEVELVYNDD